MNVIEIKNLKKVYSPRKNPVEALKGVSFSVQKGEIFGILGVNGAGKSTTLNILIGLLTPTAGRITIFGKDFFKSEDEIKQRMNIATAYADLANNLTLYRNLKVFAAIYGVKRPTKKIEYLMNDFGIWHLRNKWFGDLSAGEKTRANLCKALVNDPELLLLDEPTASLDPSIAELVRQKFLNYQKNLGLTILMTSHNMAEVEEMCGRVAFLHKGRIYMIDSPDNLARVHKEPDLERVFIKLARGEYEE
ncbi:MAG: ABC transporter ATP-binding protein [Candidatus Doudnabacteria bacterium]|nr:ABC transporter ATP-binding protein [Candidatus Doudnabacteria bacterium]